MLQTQSQNFVFEDRPAKGRVTHGIDAYGALYGEFRCLRVEELAGGWMGYRLLTKTL